MADSTCGSVLSNKWQDPGWRIEQRYSKGVLIGNWSEDRYKFEKGSEFGSSTSRQTYRGHYLKAPDPSIRLKGLIRNNGIDKEHIFIHHGKSYMRNTISLYDQTFNRGYELGERKWDGKRMAWLPEKTDHPLQGASTNFGLKEEKEEKWRKEKELESIGDFVTSNHLTYRMPPLTSYPTGRAAPHKLISSRTHPQSTNRNLKLRGMHQTLFKEVVDPKFDTN
ncbi:PREDICTED: uncharacterized protein C1orf158 homolog [Amphimedon queenslandica]|uniref:Uncharacterized protein n=1 Tax=Amphimedon queenslandica TaxID=400682 RepID=A0A1X7UDT1_AMPQE|nr:PREDICTED: uncharacterized protein C1orf158 homolog [Amphimedon queenslandica]|eukprot:XP_003388257.1 PREDICTED: uncharacterized protein C1orf158 homolog [Amphimedon queenslandica]